MAWYRAGSISVTNGSAIVNASGAAFLDAGVTPGFALVALDGRTYEIASIPSNSQLILAGPDGYQGATASGADYSIMPTSSLTASLTTAVYALIASYQAVRDGIGQGLLPDGLATSPALRFTADQDTGLFRAGPDSFGVACGGRAVAFFNGAITSFTDPTGGFTQNLVGRSDDTALLRFLNSGSTTVTGSLGFFPGYGMQLAAGAGSLLIKAADAGSIVRVGVGATLVTNTTSAGFAPTADNVFSLGVAGARWKDCYIASGAISSSDERLKTWRGGLNAAELAAAKAIAAEIGIYQWNDAIADKGAAAARLHAGLRAQRVGTIMQANGLDPAHYGFWCYDSWDAIAAVPGLPAIPATDDDPGREAVDPIPGRAAGDIYELREGELAMFIVAAQEQRLAAIEAAAAHAKS